MRDPSEIWTGKANSYDRARPTPPLALLDLLTQVIHTPHPALVVDVGSGTGLSTAIWGERAELVIGGAHYSSSSGTGLVVMFLNE